MIDVEAKLRPHHVILSAYGNIGAGHVTQGYHVEETIRALYKESRDLFRLQPKIQHWRLDLSDNNAQTSTRLVTSMYKMMQEIPLVESSVSFFIRKVQIKSLQKYIDTQVTKTAKVFYQEYLRKVQDVSILHPIIFHTTHSIPAELAILLSQELIKKHIKVHVIEYVPDPSHTSGNYAYVTTANSYFKNHIIVVHDDQSAKKLARIRKGRIIYSLGTLSNPFLSGLFIAKSRDQKKVKSEVYLCSGNYRPRINNIVGERIIVKQDEIRSGQLHVTIDAMHHRANFTFFHELKMRLRLRNLEILSISEKQKDALYEAVKQRERLKSQLAQQENVFIGVTGGEQALEKNAKRHVVGVLLAHGHEAENTKQAVEDRQVIDLRNIKPEKWDELINEAFKKGKPRNRLNQANLVEVFLA